MGCNSSKQAAKEVSEPQAVTSTSGEPDKTIHSQIQTSQETNYTAATCTDEKKGESSKPSQDESVFEQTLGEIFRFDDANKFFRAELEKLVVDDPELKAAVARGGAAHGLLEQVTLSATNERSNAFLVKGPVGAPVRVQVFMNDEWPDELVNAVEAVTGSTEIDDDDSVEREVHRLADIFNFDDKNPFFKKQLENLPLEDDKLSMALLPGGALAKRSKMVTLSATNERSNSFLVKGPVGEPVKVSLFLNEQWMGELLAAVRSVTRVTEKAEQAANSEHMCVADQPVVEKEKHGETQVASEDKSFSDLTLGDIFTFDDNNQFFKAELEKLVVDDPELKAAIASDGAAHGLVEQVTLSATNERSNAFLVKGPVGEPVRVQVFMNANWPDELINAVEAVTSSTETGDAESEPSEVHRLADVFKFDDENPFFKKQLENLPIEDDKLNAALMLGGALNKRAKMVTLSATNERSNSFLVKGPVGEPVKVRLFLNEQWMGELLAAVRKVTDVAALESQQQAPEIDTVMTRGAEEQNVQSSFWCCHPTNSSPRVFQ